ncbi:hypothetical protein [Nostoc sp.]
MSGNLIDGRNRLPDTSAQRSLPDEPSKVPFKRNLVKVPLLV